MSQAIFVPTGNEGKLREFMHAFSMQNRVCFGLKKAADIIGTDFTWQAPKEDRESFVGNGCRKLFASLSLLEKLSPHGVLSVLVDDSGLCLPRLNNSPGVHSADLAGEPRDDQRNKSHLITLLKEQLELKDTEKEPAFFVCSLIMATHFTYDIHHPKIKLKNISPAQVIDLFEQQEGEIFAQINAKLGDIHSAAFAFREYVRFADQPYQMDMVMGFCTGFVSTQEQELLPGEGHGYDSIFFPKIKPTHSFASIPLAEKNTMSHRAEALRGLIEWEKSRIVPNGIQVLF